MASKGPAKPKLNTVAKAPASKAQFALGTRPESLRDQTPMRVKPMPSQRNYGKTQSLSQPAPPAAIQPGQPMGGGMPPMARGGKVGW